ncbi:MAG: hypothetical protein IJW63_03380 [Lachnospiraceae bacterium]|nr:hypothetical protein [Lachnospiraceae bacterium]
MLGKLIKNEWKATWKFPTLISLFVLIMTILGVLSFKMPFWSKLTSANFESFSFFDLAALAILVMYFVYIVVAVYAVMIYFSIRFYKNMYTDEGYLTHTLPVKPSAHIFSKTLISGTWYLAETILMLGSLFWLLVTFFNTLTGGFELSAAELKAAGLDLSMEAANRVFAEIGGMPLWAFIALMIVITVISSYSSMLIIYLCISIGQLFKKHKVIASLLTYLVVTTVMQIVLTIAIMPVSFSMMLDGDYIAIMESSDIMAGMLAPYAMMSPLFIISLIATIVFSVVSYFVSEYIMRRKLNLD